MLFFWFLFSWLREYRDTITGIVGHVTLLTSFGFLFGLVPSMYIIVAGILMGILIVVNFYLDFYDE